MYFFLFKMYILTEHSWLCLSFSAPYSEPRISIHVNSSALKVQFETEGFPKPEVIWLGEHDQNLNYHLEIHGQTEDGLYFIKSICEAQKPVINITFTLKNHLLNQNLQRPVVLSYGNTFIYCVQIVCVRNWQLEACHSLLYAFKACMTCCKWFVAIIFCYITKNSFVCVRRGFIPV